MEIQHEPQKSIVPYPKLTHIRYFIMDIKSRSPHLHDAFELVYVLKGSIHTKVNANEYHIKQGDFLIINPNTIHSHNNGSSDGRVLLLVLQLSPMFESDYLTYLKNISFTSNGPFSEKDSEELLKLAGHFRAAAYSYFKDNGNHCRCLAYTTILLGDILKCFPHIELTGTEYLAQLHTTQRMERILRYIQANLAEPCLLKKTAEEENLSTTYLSRLFSENFHITFQQFLKQQRLEKAMKLLTSTNLPVYDICFECGFQDYRQLNKYCKDTFGKTASECRGTISTVDHGPINYNRNGVSNEFRYSDEDSILYLSDFPEIDRIQL